jgi:thiol-disulfide isomerase/thioredoxin
MLTKLKFAAIGLLAFGCLNTATAQPTYYQTHDGKIIDSATYARQKAAEEAVFQQALAQKAGPGTTLRVIDKKRLLRRNADSVVYVFKRILSMNPKDSSGEAAPGPDDFIGQPFPLTTLRTLQGTTLSLDSLKGKPTLLNFWFTTCKPCIDEMPVLNSLRQKMEGKANFVAVTFEPADKVAAFLQNHAFDFVQIADAKALTAALQIQTYPVNIFLDKYGVIQQVEGGIPYTVKGGRKAKPKIGNAKEFEAILRSLL